MMADRGRGRAVWPSWRQTSEPGWLEVAGRGLACRLAAPIVAGCGLVPAVVGSRPGSFACHRPPHGTSLRQLWQCTPIKPSTRGRCRCGDRRRGRGRCGRLRQCGPRSGMCRAGRHDSRPAAEYRPADTLRIDSERDLTELKDRCGADDCAERTRRLQRADAAHAGHCPPVAADHAAKQARRWAPARHPAHTTLPGTPV